MSDTTQTDFLVGERVRKTSLSYGLGTFRGYYPDRYSCPPAHITSPGMRLCKVETDRYGLGAAWEKDVVPA